MSVDLLDTKKIRRDFPILSSRINGKPLIYLDNAATTHKPRKVIDALSRFYKTANSNVHRGAHTLSRQATNEYEAVREQLASFIGADHSRQVIWTSGATEAANLVAQSYGASQLTPGSVVLVSAMEHHANIVPWQVVAEQTQSHVVPIPLTQNQTIDLDKYQSLLKQHKPAIIALTHVSNALGIINPVSDMIKMAKEVGATVVIDGSQAVAHEPVNLTELGCDFYFFSAHKCFGPTALGVLWGKEELLNAMPPWKTGGEMIERVSFSGTTYNQLPFKFEAGTPPIAEVIAFGESLRYLSSLNRDAIKAHENNLRSLCIQSLKRIDEIRIYAQEADNVGIVSFDLPDIHHQDLAALLDQEGIAIRAGHHCAMPLMESLGCSGTLRVSFALYNTVEEVLGFCDVLADAVSLLRASHSKETIFDHQPQLEFIVPEPYETLRDSFMAKSTWQERLALLMELENRLPYFPRQYKTDEHKLRGCESNLWLVTQSDNEHGAVAALHSDSRVMNGLGYLVLSNFSSQPIDNIKYINAKSILTECGLQQFLSASRTSGVESVISEMKKAYTTP